MFGDFDVFSVTFLTSRESQSETNSKSNLYLNGNVGSFEYRHLRLFLESFME